MQLTFLLDSSGRPANPPIALSKLQEGLLASSLSDAKDIWAEELGLNQTQKPEAPAPSKTLETETATSNFPISHKPEFLNHLTISRDRTANSNYAKEQLVVLDTYSRSPQGQSKETTDRTLWWNSKSLLNTLDGRPDDDNRPLLLDTQSLDAESITNSITRALIEVSDDSDSASFTSDVDEIEPCLEFKPAAAFKTDAGDEGDLSSKMTLKQPEFEPGDASAEENDETSLLRKLLRQMENLKEENRRLKDQVAVMEKTSNKNKVKISSTSQIFHRLSPKEVSLYPPTWMVGEKDSDSVLKLDVVLANLDRYLEKHPEIVFAVFKDYHKDAKDNLEISHSGRHNSTETMLPIEPHCQSVKLTSEEMTAAFKAFIEIAPAFSTLFPKFNVEEEIKAPFMFWYHYRSSYPLIASKLSASHRESMDLLTQWIEENYTKEYNEADSGFAKGLVSKKTIKYLIRPGDTIVCKGSDGVLSGRISTTWLEHDTDAANASTEVERKGDVEPLVTEKYFVKGWNWAYDGSFFSRKGTTTIDLRYQKPDEQVPIIDLNAYPLKYADQIDKERLRRRGEMFWNFRSHKLVEHHSSSWTTFTSDIERYMIDYDSYKKLHNEKVVLELKNKSDPVLKELSVDKGPQGDEIYLFPPKVTGYSLVRKSWVDLHVDHLYEVQWDKTAFDNLVIDRDTKELIQALVMNQLEAERGTDIISGKGNGLIILLHGGPGTGKTFTAEAVAEIAEKPLYRVTCGDIGTKPEEAEKYLESVLHLGKIWGCVVLLDEADVFLEERSLSQLERNALVSVFLRVLEYYEGILILTSNRVGTFDEAFKSRIQLALHYKNLSDNQRRRIWWNFLNRLRAMEKKDEKPTIDFDDLLDKVDDLAKDNVMNGRQIRNVITTARQLAKHRGKVMTFSDLRHVIEVTGRFDQYLLDVREGLTDDEVARSYGKR